MILQIISYLVIIIIMVPKRSLWDILFLLCFLLLLLFLLFHFFLKWLPYGAACLTPCIYPFPLKSFSFWIFNDFFYFYIGGHFEMAAILKILKTKCTTLGDDLFLCQVSKGSTEFGQNLVSKKIMILQIDIHYLGAMLWSFRSYHILLLLLLWFPNEVCETYCFCYQILSKLEDFLYFGSYFGFKMATIANQDGRHMVEHVLLHVNIHFFWIPFIKLHETL
jgi:hypothetical protein